MLKFVLALALLFSYNDFVTYDQGWAKYKEDKSPVIVIISEDYCSHCKTMKNTLLEVKKEYPDIVLSQMGKDEARKKGFLRGEAIPQTFMYAFDKEQNKTVSFPMLIGSRSKADIYRLWGMK